jgi:hypothetical protein
MIAIKYVELQNYVGSKAVRVSRLQQQLRTAIEGSKVNVSERKKETSVRQPPWQSKTCNSHPNSDVDPPDLSIIVRNRTMILNKALA